MILAIPLDEDKMDWTHVWLGLLSLAAAIVGVWKLYETNRMREMGKEIRENNKEIEQLKSERTLSQQSAQRQTQIIGLLREEVASLTSMLRRYEHAAREAHIETDLRGIIKRWDAGATIMFGYTNEQAIGQDLAEICIPPEYRQSHKNGMEAIRYMFVSPNRANSGKVYEVNIGPRTAMAIAQDGERFPAEVTLSQPWQLASTGEWQIAATIKKLELPQAGSKLSLSSTKDYLPSDAELEALERARRRQHDEKLDAKGTDTEIPALPKD